MQKTISTDKGLAISRILIAFSMFSMVINPMKYSWVTILPGLAMIYFSSKKYNEEKKAGIDQSKFGLITIMLCVAVAVLTAVTIAYYLDEHGYL